MKTEKTREWLNDVYQGLTDDAPLLKPEVFSLLSGMLESLEKEN